MSVLFVADIHLCRQRPDLTSAFIQFLDNTARTCESLYLLGDIFEAWIGDDYVDPHMQGVVQALRRLSEAGVKLFFQHGNRDFLVGQDFASSIGAELLSETKIVDFGKTKALVMHGDQLCTDDTEYQNFRSMVRSAQWQMKFLGQSIAQRLVIAGQLRSASQEKNQLKSAQITDVNQNAVEHCMRDNNVKLLIHGHTHRPAVHQFNSQGQALTRMVLGDWGQSLWYIQCTTSGCELIERSIK